eukprot:6490537-Amphidinium_carterae.2
MALTESAKTQEIAVPQIVDILVELQQVVLIEVHAEVTRWASPTTPGELMDNLQQPLIMVTPASVGQPHTPHNITSK